MSRRRPKIKYSGDDRRGATVRTNIIMEEPLVEEAKAVTGIKTKAGVVHYALRELVRRAKRMEMLKLQGKINWRGDLSKMRESRKL